MTQQEQLQSLLADGSVRRSSALRAAGIRPQAVANALSAGLIARSATGSYYRPGTGSAPELVGLAAACSRMPRGVVCLMSAAYLCDLIDRPPEAIWIAVPVGAHGGKEGETPQRIVRWSYPGALEVGVVDKEVCGVRIRHTGAARTVVDLLRYRRWLKDPEIGVRAVRRLVELSESIDELADLAKVVRLPREALKVLKTVGTALEHVDVLT